VSELAPAVPGVPYRGIHPFRYVDHAIFFARGDETRRLASLVSVYRGVLLYGDSGSGKSSLVNAGLIPEAIRLGFAPERVRVQPRASEELVVERIHSADDDEKELLPSVLAPGKESPERTVLAVDAFEERVRAACEQHRPLLIFDQFEEIATLFDEARACDAQRRLLEVFVRLLRGSLPVKVLFSFREDYLGKVKELLSACPELVDQALRITPPSSDALPTIIRGPFERYPDHFARPLSPALASRLVTVLAERFGAGDISLSEVQTVCLRLWESDDPETLLTEKGPQGLLEDYLGEALGDMPAQLRPAALVLLAQMVTSAGTRNVISAGDLFQRVQEQEGDITPGLLEQALEHLSQSRLVRRERRRDLDLYEITSEFLVPWISRRRAEFRRLQDRRRDRRRLLILGSIAMALLLVGTVIAVFAVNAVQERNRADRQRNLALSAQIAAESEVLDSQEPLPASLLAVAAWRIARTAQARVSLLDVLAQPDHGVPLVGRPPAHAVAFSPDGRTLATAGAYYSPKAGSARLWRVATRQLEGALLKPDPGEITAVAFSPTNGTIMATAGLDGSARLWDTHTKRQIQWLRAGHLTSLTAVAFSPDGKVLATAGADGTARLWDLATGRQVGAFRASRIGAVNAVAFSPGGKTLATAGADGTARLWNLATRSQIGTPLAVGIGGMNAVAFSPDGKTLATAGADGTARLWDVTVYRPMGTPLAARADAVNAMVFSPDGKTLATAGADGTVRLWDLATGRQAGAPLAAGTGGVNAMVFSPDGKTLATAGAGGTVRLWDLATGRQAGAPLAAGTGAVNAVAFSPDGRTLATGGADGIARLWNVETHRKMGESPPNNLGLKSVVFSPDGKTLATAGNNKIMLWTGSSGKLQQSGTPLAAGNEAMNAVAFSPDSRTIASASDDGTARLWDIETHQQVGPPLMAGSGGVNAVTFSPDGKVLVTGSSDGTAQRWNVALPEDKYLANAACAISGRSLMPREWASFIKSVPFRQVCP
jgi:WD40 repeat protein